MKSNFVLAALALGAALLAAGSAGAQTVAGATPRPMADLSFTYSGLRANIPVGNCGCFWMRGGSGELAVLAWRPLWVVAEVSGERIRRLPQNPQIGLSLASAMGGLRLTHPFHQKWIPFAQGLVGVAHGFDSYFPGESGTQGAASSLAMAAGLGLDLRIKKHVSLRLAQAEYQYMELPNNAVNPANQQHDIRLSAGVVFRLSR